MFMVGGKFEEKNQTEVFEFWYGKFEIDSTYPDTTIFLYEKTEEIL